ncbi:hypothetical protein HORIV_50910 [Vreelandella olivaria]|uniref:Uncharacterized protein n=1 Tax=Vreelandella olivaria TaxID=390919 RepID=A0ABM7GPV2_9GAMM|nr:hypothetical protein HORIV_50910 [Halomonas olivaria]
MLLLLTALVAVSVVSLLMGAGSVGPLRVVALLGGAQDSEASFIVWELRAPRTLIGIAVGMALGVAGALLQAVARNPLAEPGLLGVSAGRRLPWRWPWFWGPAPPLCAFQSHNSAPWWAVSAY